jgi:hypothetical protein
MSSNLKPDLLGNPSDGGFPSVLWQFLNILGLLILWRLARAVCAWVFGRKRSNRLVLRVTPEPTPECSPTVPAGEQRPPASCLPTPLEKSPLPPPLPLLSRPQGSLAQRMPSGYGIAVGRTNYPVDGPWPDLPRCAQDSLRVACAWHTRRVGVSLLYDLDATVERFLQELSIAVVRAHLRPSEPLWVFLSSHGTRGAATRLSLAEQDDREDYIVLDRSLQDDHIARMLAWLPKDTPLVFILDACFSGGFENEICSRQGSVLFMGSSGESVTSLCAEEHKAGGYLSGLVIEALRTIRGPITMGGLRRHVLRRWGAYSSRSLPASREISPGVWVRGVRQLPIVFLKGREDQIIAGAVEKVP